MCAKPVSRCRQNDRCYRSPAVVTRKTSLVAPDDGLSHLRCRLSQADSRQVSERPAAAVRRSYRDRPFKSHQSPEAAVRPGVQHTGLKSEQRSCNHQLKSSELLYPTATVKSRLLDEFISTEQERIRHFDAKITSYHEIDCQIVLEELLD